MSQPEVQKMFSARNIEARSSRPDEMAKIIRDEMVQWGNVVKRANVKMD